MLCQTTMFCHPACSVQGALRGEWRGQYPDASLYELLSGKEIWLRKELLGQKLSGDQAILEHVAADNVER